MGGKALKTVETRRYTTAELLEAAERVKKGLYNEYWHCGGKNGSPRIAEIIVPQWFRSKETHGDLDLLVFIHKGEHMEYFGNTIRGKLERAFGATEVVHNGPTWSFNLDDLQVDLNIQDAENLGIAEVWFAYNDLSCLIGRIFRFWHLKWSPEGLILKVFGKTRSIVLGELLISKNPRRIFDLLGYSFDRWLEGFDTMDDVFEFIASGTRFSTECCDPKYMSNDVRIRDNKRLNVQAFDAWLDARRDQYVCSPRPTLDDTIALIEAHFPEAGIRQAIAVLEGIQEMKEAVAAKFNGHHVKENFGIDGKALGEAMGHFKAIHGDNYATYILSTDQERIIADFGGMLGALG